MLMIVFLIIAILIGFVPTKDKTLTKVISAFIFLVIWIVIGFNTATPDFESYLYMYEHCFDAMYSLHEPGYILLCKLCLTLNFTFQQFRIVVASVIVLFAYLTVKKIDTKSMHTVSMLFLLFPACQFASGLRTAVASVIACYAIACLLEDKPRSLARYVFWLAVACCFHYESVFYFVFLFAYKRNVNLSAILVLLAVEVVAFFALLRTNVLFGFLSRFISSGKVTSWFNFSAVNHPSLITIVGLLMLNVLQVFILYECKRYITQHCVVSPRKLETVAHTNTQIIRITNCFYLLLLMLFGYMINISFFRLTINMMLVFYAIVIKTLDSKVLISTRRSAMDRTYIILAMLVLIVVLNILIDPQVTQMAIENNVLL